MNKSSFNNLTPARSSLICLIMILILSCPLPVFSWDGIDYETGNYIEIDDSDIPSIAPGVVIQIYDNEDSNHHTVDITSVVKNSDETNIEVFDQDTVDCQSMDFNRYNDF